MLLFILKYFVALIDPIFSIFGWTIKLLPYQMKKLRTDEDSLSFVTRVLFLRCQLTFGNKRHQLTVHEREKDTCPITLHRTTPCSNGTLNYYLYYCPWTTFTTVNKRKVLTCMYFLLWYIRYLTTFWWSIRFKSEFVRILISFRSNNIPIWIWIKLNIHVTI